MTRIDCFCAMENNTTVVYDNQECKVESVGRELTRISRIGSIGSFLVYPIDLYDTGTALDELGDVEKLGEEDVINRWINKYRAEFGTIRRKYNS